MQSEYGRDLADEDRPVFEAVEERPGKTIKLRIHPMIFRRPEGKAGMYRAWKDVHWTLECETPEEAFALREAMRLLFRAICDSGLESVLAALRAVKTSEE